MGKLSKKAKMEIIRELMIKNPVKQHIRGFNRWIIRQFKEDHSLNLSEQYACMLIKDVKREFTQFKGYFKSREEYFVMLIIQLENAEKAGDRGEARRILNDMLKLEGYLKDQIEITAGDVEKGKSITQFFKEKINGKKGDDKKVNNKKEEQ